jgi:hypothetical protein
VLKWRRIAMQEITVRSVVARRRMVLNLELVKELIRCYLMVVPGEKRTLPISVASVRLADELAEMEKAEQAAIDKLKEKNVTSDIMKGVV